MCSSAALGQYVRCACCAVTHVWITWITVDREGICKCGYPKIQHCDEAIKPEDYMEEQWDKHRHVRELPTDAFGDISFGGPGQKTGKVKLWYRCLKNTANENELKMCSPSGHQRCRWVCFFVRFGEMCLCISVSVMDALQWMGAVRMRVW